MKKSVLIAGLLLALPVTVAAAPTPAVNSGISSQLVKTDQKIRSQREAYKNAVEAIKRGDYAEARRIQKNSLSDYPLNVWLDYFYLSRDLDVSHYGRVVEFIRSGQEHELGEMLRDKYVDYLSTQREFKKVASLMPEKPYADDEVLSKSRQGKQCRYYEARWHTGKADSSAVSFAAKVYSQLKPISDGCFGLLALWETKGYLSDKVRLQKFEKAFISNRYLDLTRKLAGELSKTQFGLAVGRAMTYIDSPDKVMTLSDDGSLTTHQAAVMLFKRYANLQPKDASTDLDTFIKRFKPTVTEKMDIYRIVSGGMMGHSRTKEDVLWVDRNLPAVAWTDELREMRLRRALWFSQWDTAYGLLKNLPETERKEINWRYWTAYTAQKNGYKEESRRLMEEVAKDRSFYGFLAAQKLGRKMPFNNKGLSKEADWSELRKDPAVVRFFELYAMDDANASIEWREIAKHSPENVALMMAEWALKTDNVNYAIQSVVAGKRWDALDYRFPAPYYDLYTKYSRSTNVSLTFLYGISRQESMMNPVIRSPAGAVGLMQLMPGTAKLVSKKNKWPYQGVSDLVVPEKNIRLGSAYLRNMLDKFDNNRILAAAAYNAGPNRVYRWASSDGIRRDADVYVENIPFTETRKYVQNVILYDAIYNKLLMGKEGDLLRRSELSYNY